MIPRQVEQQVKRGQELEERIKGQGKPAEGNGQDKDPAPAPSAELAELREANRKLNDRVQTLTGMLDKTGLRAENESLVQERDKLRAELDSTRADMGNIQQRLDELEAGKAQGDVKSKLAELDEDEVPSAVKEIMAGQAEQIASLVGKLREANEKISSFESKVSEMGEAQTQSAETRFWTDFNAAIPDAPNINRDPAFKAWMEEVDPSYKKFTGLDASRQALLEAARKRLDVQTCINFYETWKELANTNAAVPSEDTRVSPNDGPAQDGGEGRGQKRTWTVAEFQQLTQDAINGRISEEEYNRLHRDYMEAAQDGRLRLSNKRK